MLMTIHTKFEMLHGAVNVYVVLCRFIFHTFDFMYMSVGFLFFVFCFFFYGVHAVTMEARCPGLELRVWVLGMEPKSFGSAPTAETPLQSPLSDFRTQGT